ncbi:MAG: class I SAM-dependent methyltransferase [Candidatus Thiodiazotropha endolucinida]|uniref:Class I SAM-dependent methyltransferase n=1 Tax=Candidatus Thiodiazotropha taylori TaxID=2792791 RepID=A0A9E4TW80_9GAMM|nr:class I SAM-dependent methyltransferase [Candidatus Thiodiazotropha taylori]MCW4238703.1 class I SAM-dependent methyltransferase [Candidatus Thiodiazotropha endolucinida]
MKPYSEACDENKGPILEVLLRLYRDVQTVLEIGSGTGQHAVHFATAMPHLTWQTSDMEENHPGIRAWLREAALPNVRNPIGLDVNRAWPAGEYDAIFSANTTHIMSWPEVELMFQGVGQVLKRGGCFALYGPFNYQGGYTSESNQRFDQWLKSRDPLSGIRDFEMLDELAASNHLIFSEDVEMPVNNRILVWYRDR